MAEQWYYTTHGKQMDPVTTKELQHLVAQGILKPTDMVWKDGMPRWIRASSVQVLYPDPIANFDRLFTSPTTASRADATAAASPGSSAKPSTAIGPSDEVYATKGNLGAQEDDEPRSRSRRRRADFDAEDDRSRRPSRNEGGSNAGIVIALVLGVGVLFAGLAGGLFLLVMAVRPGPPPQPAAAPNAPFVLQPAEANPNGPGNDVKPKPPVDLNKDQPLPVDVKTGKRLLQNIVIAPGADHDFRLRVMAGYASSVRVTNHAKRLGPVELHIHVLKDSDNAEIKSEIGPTENPRVEFSLPMTEFVRVRIHNASKTVTVTCTVFYDGGK